MNINKKENILVVSELLLSIKLENKNNKINEKIIFIMFKCLIIHTPPYLRIRSVKLYEHCSSQH